MSNRINVLTPVGRLVQGSLYDPQTTDAENRPLVVKSGINAGKPRVDYFFSLAIPKGAESHWNQTDWGQKIWSAGITGFPNGQTQALTFAWKVVDGDSQIPNKAGRRPCDREGFVGHWVLNFSGGFAPSIHNNDGSKQIVEKYAVNLGDYIQVYGNVADNGSTQQPGVYLNHSMIALIGYGERIFLGVDPSAVGFGGALPPGASATPLAAGFNPVDPIVPPAVPAPAAPAAPAAVVQTSTTPAPVVPYPQILVPPVPPAAPKRTLLPAANGATYEQLIASGWTDELLIQHGLMQP